MKVNIAWVAAPILTVFFAYEAWVSTTVLGLSTSVASLVTSTDALAESVIKLESTLDRMATREFREDLGIIKGRLLPKTAAIPIPVLEVVNSIVTIVVDSAMLQSGYLVDEGDGSYSAMFRIDPGLRFVSDLREPYVTTRGDLTITVATQPELLGEGLFKVYIMPSDGKAFEDYIADGGLIRLELAVTG